MSAYYKTLTRMFKKHITRFISIILMVLVAVGFISGIGSASDKINYSLDDYYKSQNVSDFIVRNKSDSGTFTDEEIEKVKNIDGVKDVVKYVSVDACPNENEEQVFRLYFFESINKADWPVNVPDNLPESADDKVAYVERADNKIKGVTAEEIELDFAYILTQLAELNGETAQNVPESLKTKFKTTVTIGAEILCPLTFALDGEPSDLNGDDFEVPDLISSINELETLDNILYMSADVIPSVELFGMHIFDKNDMPQSLFVTIENRNLFGTFSPKYKEYIASVKGEIEKDCGAENVRVLTLEDNYSFKALKSYSDKVMGIGLVLMVAFVFVTALVVLSTMTRLLEEERSQIACLKTLGYSAPKIILKYLLFAMFATVIGGVSSYFLGLGLSHLIYWVFNYSFVMPPVSSHIALLFFIITISIIVVTTIGATLIAGHKMTREVPASLLRPKPPKAGKKVFLERIPPLWNRLSFKYKSTLRNVLRYKSRFFMTLIAVAVSTALVQAGLALLDLCLFGSISSFSIMLISVVVVAFAGLLTIAVIYTLTNINVSERNRELATLQVLGYTDKEIAGYIYREIYIDTAVGIAFGYPVSALFIWAVFTVLGMGTLGAVSWFWWLITPAIVFAFTAFVTLILRHKIVKIDMNESLKAIE